MGTRRRLTALLALCILHPHTVSGADACGDPLPDHDPDHADAAGCPLGWRCEARLGTIRFRHLDRVNAVAWEPAGTRVASAGADGIARVWDVSGRPLDAPVDSVTFPNTPLMFQHRGRVTALAWDPSGRWIASGSDDRGTALRLWEARTGKEAIWVIRDEKGKEQAPELKVPPGLPTPVRATADYRPFGEGQGPVTALAWSPRGKTVAAAGSEGLIRLWDVASGGEVRRYTGHGAGTLWALAFDPSGSRLASGSADRTLRIWDAAGDRPALAIGGFHDTVTAVAWSPDGSRVASGCGEGSITLWDAATGEAVLAFARHPGPVLSLAFSPDGKRLLSGGEDASARAGCKDSLIHVWDAASGGELMVLAGHRRAVTSLAWDRSGGRILSGSADRTLRIWDAGTGRPIEPFQGHRGDVRAVCWSPDGRRILTGGEDRALRVWDAPTGRPLMCLEGHGSGVLCAAWSPDGRHLASGGEDDTVRIWDAASGAGVRVIVLHRCAVTALAWTPDSRRLLTAGEDKVIHLWDAGTGEELLSFSGHGGWITCLACRPDGSSFVSGSWDRTLRLWDLSSGRELRGFEGHTGYVTCAAWGPDGKDFISGSWDGSIRRWDPATGKEVQRYGDPRGLVSRVSLEPPKRHWKKLDDGGRPDPGKVPEERRNVIYKAMVNSVSWNRQGQIVSGDNGNLIFLWDATEGKTLDCFAQHRGAVLGVAWDPAGRAFASAGGDGSGLLFCRR